MDPLLCLWPQCYTKAPGGVIIRQGLLAVYAEVVKGHTLWHMDTVNNAKSAIIAARNRSSYGTTYMLYMFGARNLRSILVLLV